MTPTPDPRVDFRYEIEQELAEWAVDVPVGVATSLALRLQAALDAHYAAMGLVVAPREATKEMMEAGLSVKFSELPIGSSILRARYTAMIAAAPPASAPEASDVPQPRKRDDNAW